MIISNEHRFVYVYFFLSGAIVSALLIIIYFSVRFTINEQLLEDVKVVQKSLKFIKPHSQWQYNNTWQYIGNHTLRHKVYSAYFDSRIDVIDDVFAVKSGLPIGSIRIFAILPNGFSETITCILRSEDFTFAEVEAQEAITMQEDHSTPYAPYTVMCPLYVASNHSSVYLPQAAAIAFKSNFLSHLSPTFIEISYPRNMTEMFAKSRPVLSVCIGPLQFQYADVLRMVEFIEMYRILGATHFYFYNLDASDDVLRALDYYKGTGVADVLPWNLKDYGQDIHYGGIGAQINDCIYRAMVVDNYRYAAVVDLDEILVPLKHNSLKEFLRHCDEGRTSAFVFRNVFFHKRDGNDTFSVPAHTRNRMLYTQVKIRRTVEIMAAYRRSKSIVNPRSVIEMGNHRVLRILPSYADHVVHQTVGLLFHYRNKCLNCKSTLMIDYTARRFGSLIWDRVDDSCMHVFMENNGICPTAMD